MRKKYLSALLFGALLFASAGTFTSCKDYDDDISNLQEQINTVVADLNDLKALVGDGGVSSVTFDEATGVLTVVDAAGTHTYTIKTSAGEVGEVTITIDGQDLVVNGEVVGQVGDKVEVNENGELTVNGEGTGITVGKYAILENESDNTYTITLPDAEGNLQTITLLKSVATNLTVNYFYTSSELNNDYYYSYYSLFTEINPTILGQTDNGSGNEFKYSSEFETENGIAWGVASADVDWKGPKGAVKAGQLLIGQQNNVLVQVLPRNIELDKQSLKLVDRDGNVAPVVVTPTAYNYGSGSTGSRAVSNEGQWALDITMDNTITANNIGTAFAKQDHTINNGNHDGWSNRLYALQINGNVLTNYAFVIDTDENACEMTGKDELSKTNGIIKVDGMSSNNNTFNVGLGSHNLTFEQASVYDYIFEIVDADKNDAEAWGITLENNTLTAANTTTAAGRTIHLNVKLLGVDGKVFDFGYTSATTTPIAITFGNATTGAITLPVSTYKVTPDEYDNSQTTGKYATMVLDMGDLFSGLTAQEAIAIQENKNGEISLKTSDETFVFLRNTIVSKYNEVGEGKTICFYEADGETVVDFADKEADIRKIKYAKVIYNMADPADLWNPKATLGEHTLQMILTDAAGNQIRKANIPVNVTVPTFFELFTKSAAWTDNSALAVVDESGNIDLKQLYNNKSSADVVEFFDLTSTFIADGKSAGTLDNNGTDVTANTVELNANAVNNHALKDLATELVYKIVPECSAFWVTSGDFTMDVVTKLDAAKFIYYGTDGKETNIIVQPETENKIKAYQVTNGVKTGLSFYKAGTDNVFTSGVVVNGFTLDVANDILLPMEFDDNAGDKATAKFEHGVLTVSGLAKGNYTTVLTVTYKAASEFDGTSVYETFQIPLTVQGVEE